MTKRALIKTSITTTVSALSLLLLAGPAQASERITLSMPVTWGDLDLTHAEGQAALDRRIARAGKQICGSPHSRTLRDQMDTHRCLQEVAASAAPQRERAIARASEVRARLALAQNR